MAPVRGKYRPCYQKFCLDGPLPLSFRVLHPNTVRKEADFSFVQNNCCSGAPHSPPKMTEKVDGLFEPYNCFAASPNVVGSIHGVTTACRRLAGATAMVTHNSLYVGLSRLANA